MPKQSRNKWKQMTKSYREAHQEESKQWAVDRPGMRRTAGIQEWYKSHDATLIEEADRITDVMPRCALQGIAK